MSRDDLITAIPWVKRYTGKQKGCEGIKWSQVALKHLYSMGGRPPEGIPDRAKCKFKAKWHFTALRPSKWNMPAKTGDYCIHHLFTQIYDYPREYARYVKWNQEQHIDMDPEGRYEEPYTGAMPEDQG